MVCRRLDAAIGNPKTPGRFWVLPRWKKATDGFFHGQLARQTSHLTGPLLVGKPDLHFAIVNDAMPTGE